MGNLGTLPKNQRTNIMAENTDGITIHDEKLGDIKLSNAELKELEGSSSNETDFNYKDDPRCPRALVAFLDLFVDYQPAASQLTEAYEQSIASRGITLNDDQEMNGSEFTYQMDPGLAIGEGTGTSCLAIGRIKSLIEQIAEEETSHMMLPDFSEENKNSLKTSRPLSDNAWCIE